MNTLPIKFISESDQPVFGANIFNLAKLERLNFPVARGVATAAPEIVLKTVLEEFDSAGQEVFEQRLTVTKNKLAKIPLPSGLESALGKEKSFWVRGQIYKRQEHVWQGLLNVWYEEIKAKLWRLGFNKNLTLNLTPQLIFFAGDKSTCASAYFDPNLSDVVIRAVGLHPSVLKEIDGLVLSANKKLFFPQIYYFLIAKEKVQLVGISPFTQTLATSPISDIVIPKPKQKELVRSAIKVFFNLSRGFVVPGGIDGVLIEGEKAGEFEETVFKLAEAALSFVGKPVIFKLPDVSAGDVRGALRLIHQKSLLDEAAKAFLFVRNKKDLLNIELMVPFTRSPDELLQLKRELASREISRKSTLKLWMEVAVPENIINMEDYLAVGIDGVILDLDALQKFLGGYGVEEGEFYRRQVAALVKFIQPVFKVLHKAALPVLVKGELSLHPDVLDCLIEGGVWGIVANTEIEAESLPEHLNWSERRMVAKRFT